MRRSKTMFSRSIAALAVATLVATGCSRSDGDAAKDNGGDNTATTAGKGEGGKGEGGETSLDAGGFGDLSGVCSDGDGAASGTGVSGDTMKIGVVTDKGAEARPGLNKEMYDAGVAFSKWCNEHGGINGLKIEVVDLDAKLFEFPSVVATACTDTFALVGGGAALDDEGHDARVACGLPNFAGYVVSENARKADLQVFAVPGPADKILSGPFRVLNDVDPEAMKKVGTLATSLPSVLITVQQDMEAMEDLGAKNVYNNTFSAAGESNYRPFVTAMKEKDVQVLDYAGEPGVMITLDKAFAEEGWRPKYVTMQANMYDDRYVEEGGSAIGNVLIRSSFFPIDMAADNKATQDYIDLIGKYAKDGKVAMLGEQATSSWLLFAKSVKECGSDVTRECIVEKGSAVTDWTGGGLHGATDPSTNGPADCFLTMTVEDGKFVYSEKFTAPTEGDGLFNCSEDNVFTTTVQDKN